MKKATLIKIIIIIVLVIGIVVYLNLMNKKASNNTIYLKEKNVKIKIDNSRSLNDELGREESDYKTFTIKADKINSNTANYEIYVKQINSTNSINERYVKLYLEDSNNKRPLLSKPLIFGNLKTADNDLEARQLYKGSIIKNQDIKLNIRMWLADTYTVNNTNKNFEVLVGVSIIK